MTPPIPGHLIMSDVPVINPGKAPSRRTVRNDGLNTIRECPLRSGYRCYMLIDSPLRTLHIWQSRPPHHCRCQLAT